MKKWTGFLVIITLASLLLLRYFSILTATGGPHHHHHPRAHFLSSLPGFTDLFPPTNFNTTGPTSLLVWAHMKPLLARPDSLPATRDGVKEAAAAWRRLTTTTTLAAENPVNDTKQIMNCPFSVSGGDGDRLLRIPCGLVEDAAVTLIGVPNGGGGGGFRVELVGSDSAVVFGCNVSLGKEEGEEAMAMSSWTPEFGWGEWERCPPYATNANNAAAKGNSLVSWFSIMMASLFLYSCLIKLGKSSVQLEL